VGCRPSLICRLIGLCPVHTRARIRPVAVAHCVQSGSDGHLHVRPIPANRRRGYRRGRRWVAAGDGYAAPTLLLPLLFLFLYHFAKLLKLCLVLTNYVGLVLLVGIISRGLGETDIFTQSIQIPIPNSLDRCRALKNEKKTLEFISKSWG
jgi:hypothetical protein